MKSGYDESIIVGQFVKQQQEETSNVTEKQKPDIDTEQQEPIKDKDANLGLRNL